MIVDEEEENEEEQETQARSVSVSDMVANELLAHKAENFEDKQPRLRVDRENFYYLVQSW